jgi:hypothetical protein
MRSIVLFGVGHRVDAFTFGVRTYRSVPSGSVGYQIVGAGSSGHVLHHFDIYLCRGRIYIFGILKRRIGEMGAKGAKIGQKEARISETCAKCAECA